ncbi:MAG: glycerophosphodiester phosphodiesterase family protein [Desulfobacterales bacterium]
MKKRLRNKSSSLTSYPWFLEYFGIRLIDRLFEIWPCPIPTKHKLKQGKIVPHRGIYDNQRVLENTLKAFEGVKRLGLWGVEFDLRWTKDLVPLAFHDKTLHRLFGLPVDVSQQTFSEIRSRFPIIPTLKEVVNRFGKDLHLMVEIKKENYSDVIYQNKVLKDIFKKLHPRKDFHLLSLNPDMFELISFVSKNACLPIATKNVGAYSHLALRRGYGGVNGHYLLVNNSTIVKHHKRNQKVGTGFVESANCLFRELNRGVDWVFTKDAVKLQSQIAKIMDRYQH